MVEKGQKKTTRGRYLEERERERELKIVNTFSFLSSSNHRDLVALHSTYKSEPQILKKFKISNQIQGI